MPVCIVLQPAGTSYLASSDVRVIDLLIATLVLFPWLSEGIEYRIPGWQTVELSDLGLPALAVALVVIVVHRCSRDPMALGKSGLVALRRLSSTVTVTTAAVASAITVMAWLGGRWVLTSAGFEPEVALWRISHGTGAVLLVAGIAVAIRRASNEPWQASFFLRQAMKMGLAWLRAIERAPALALWTAAAAVGAVFLSVSLVRHSAFESHGWDLGIFTNGIWNLTHSNGYVSSLKGGINLFADHQSPLFWLLAPVFWLVPRPETLLCVQAFGLAAGGPALYYLSRPRFAADHWAPAALPWLYWSYLPLRNANAFDFHPEVFMLPLFLWAFVGLASERRGMKLLGVLAIVAALAAKESASVVAVGIGLAWVLGARYGSHPRRWPGVALIIVGGALFIFDIQVVPWLFGHDYAYLRQYSRFGGGATDLILAPFTRPLYFISQLVDRPRLDFLFWTLAPLAFLPLFAWRAAIAVLPAYLMLFLSEGDQRLRLVFHYGIEPGTALFWALPLGFAAFGERFGWKVAGAWALVWAVACHGGSEFARVRSYDRFPHADWLATQLIPCLDPTAATAASDSLVPHLATRAWISYPDQLRQSPSGEPVSCVVIDLAVDNWPLGRAGATRVLADLPALNYRKAWNCYDASVYQLPGSRCLRCIPQCY
jgi:uncharacterized membrane protein